MAVRFSTIHRWDFFAEQSIYRVLTIKRDVTLIILLTSATTALVRLRRPFAEVIFLYALSLAMRFFCA